MIVASFRLLHENEQAAPRIRGKPTIRGEPSDRKNPPAGVAVKDGSFPRITTAWATTNEQLSTTVVWRTAAKSTTLERRAMA